MPSLPPDQNVGFIFVGALFYGLYLSTLFQCLRWLIFADEGWKLHKKIGWAMLSITISIFVLSTIFRALALENGMVQALEASKPKPKPPPGSVFKATALPWVAVVGCTNANISTLLADAVLVYRCWIVYGKSRKVIVFPILIWMGGLVLTILQAYWQVVQSASILKAWQPVNMTVGPGTILMPFWASSIILNGYSTFMIVRCIYRVSKDSIGTGVYQLKFAMQVLAESGFLYLAVAVAHFVSWWTPNSYAIEVISAINASITGIAFNLILIRVAQRRVEEANKGADFGPISDLRFNLDALKSPAPPLEGGTTDAISFHHQGGSNLMTQSNTTSVV